jgi:hypothetical protein
LDRYPYRLPVKGGFRQLVADIIVITSPYHPKYVYGSRTVEDINQLLRRIHVIKYFEERGKSHFEKNDLISFFEEIKN